MKDVTSRALFEVEEMPSHKRSHRELISGQGPPQQFDCCQRDSPCQQRRPGPIDIRRSPPSMAAQFHVPTRRESVGGVDMSETLRYTCHRHRLGVLRGHRIVDAGRRTALAGPACTQRRMWSASDRTADAIAPCGRDAAADVCRRIKAIARSRPCRRTSWTGSSRPSGRTRKRIADLTYIWTQRADSMCWLGSDLFSR
jgi:hypothetical protein